MKKLYSIISGSFFCLSLATTTALASDLLTQSSGEVKSVTSQEIVVEYQDSTHPFVITERTKICVDGFQTDDWQKLLKAQTATITTNINSNIAIRIDNQPMLFDLRSPFPFPIQPECK